ncbi:LysR family transcriptional regulator [Salipiger pacificus]|nr:LysR family transcriptional regulator [Alloyangia pacifica]
MNISQLTAFREVMKSASLSQAARNLNRTQPAVSLSIKALEESLGITLFRREGRRMLPVPEAHYLFDESEEIINRLTNLTGTMRRLAQGEAGQLTVASMPGPATYLMPRFLSDVLGSHPDITLSLLTRTTPQIRQLAGSQSIDFGFGDYIPDSQNAQIVSEDVIHTRCLCAVPATSRLAKAEAVSLADLSGRPMGLLTREHPLTQYLTRVFDEAGAELKIAVQSQFFLPLMQFIAAGRCFAIVDPLSAVTERLFSATGNGVVFRPLVETIPYAYALYTPVHRPPSRLAERTKIAWLNEVRALLERTAPRP